MILTRTYYIAVSTNLRVLLWVPLQQQLYYYGSISGPLDLWKLSHELPSALRIVGLNSGWTWGFMEGSC